MPGLAWLTAQPVAHRGLHDRTAGRVENTLGAAAAAVAGGFAIECDLQLTRDDAVIAFHDDTLERLTDGSGRVDRASLADIKALTLRDSAERIPTFTELLDTVAGRVPLVVELKSTFKGDRRLEQQTAKLLAAYSGPVAVMSFDPASMRAMQGLAPALPRGLVADCFREKDYPELSSTYRFALRNLLYAGIAGVRFIAYDVKALPANAPLLLRHLGFPLLTWTVRTAADRETVRRYADQMIFEDFVPATIAPGRASAESA